MYYTQEQIDRANQADLVSFLQSQGEQLTRAGNEYRWKRHDSLTVRGNKWYRHSQSKGGGPVDFVMEFFGKSFTEAVELLTGEKGAAPPPDRHCPAPLSDFRLPPRSTDNRIARNYLTAARRIDEDVTGFFLSNGDIYEEAAHHNAVFVGRDESGIPRYAHQRGTAGSFRLDVKGSDKAFNFCYRGDGERLFVFEAPMQPFQVIYQTAEDGLGDTVKPRLIEAAADLDRVLVIDEAKRELTLSDERIEKAITQNGARLIILDPIQAYMGEKTDMNRANEVRPMFRRLADVAERTGCAVILIGHLNKAAGGQSAYRGLGSIDFRAAARSVLLIGRVKREPNVRVIIHDKSSLAPEGKPVAFCLDPETGFEWIGEYDITADELLSGAGGNNATKTEQAEKLILDLLADGKELASEDIEKAAADAGISARTVRAAKKNLDGRITSKRIGAAWYHALKK